MNNSSDNPAPASQHEGTTSPEPSSFANLVHKHAADGSKVARTILRAIECAATSGADAFRSFAYLPLAANQTAPLVLKASTTPSKATLEINLLEWFSTDELQKRLPWLDSTIRLSRVPKPARSAVLISARARVKPESAQHGAICIEIMPPQGDTCQIVLTAQFSTQNIYCALEASHLDNCRYHLKLSDG